MKKSEKLLLSGLLAALGIFVVIPGIWSFFRGPVAVQEELLTSETDRLTTAENEFATNRARVMKMREFKELSLSSNASQGSLTYQQWLHDLAEHVAKFDGTEITPERVSPSRDKSYVSVRMRVSGKGTAEQLREFLFRFHRAAVLHRIVGMHIESLDNSSRPRLDINLTTEAVSLRDAETKGTTLFARTELAEKPDGKTIVVASTNGFPSEVPFEVRIGDVYAQVTTCEGTNWTVMADGEKFEADKGAVVEHSPIHPEFVDATLSDFDAFVQQNPFAKPAPYRPRLDLIGTKSILRGNTMTLTAKATGFDTGGDKTTYELQSKSIDGLALEADKLSWNPPTSVEAGEYSVTIVANAPGLKEPLESSFSLNLSDVNQPPTIERESDEPLVAVIGRPVSFSVRTSDPETRAEDLVLAIGSGAPEGCEIQPDFGIVVYTPTEKTEPGMIEVPVQVTDNGSPAQTSTITVSIAVQDDKSQFTVFSGAVAADDDRQAWLRDQSTDTKFYLREGQRLKYAGYDALVLTIGKDYFLFKQDNDTLRLELGQTLKEARVIATATPEKSPADSEDSPRPVDTAEPAKVENKPASEPSKVAPSEEQPGEDDNSAETKDEPASADDSSK